MLLYSIIPNPAESHVEISLVSKSKGSVNIVLLDYHGNAVLNVGRNISIGDNTIEIDVSTLSRDMYTLSLRDNAGSRTAKKLFKK